MKQGRAKDIYENLKSKGLEVIEQYFVNRQSEELFLDFKRSADNGEGKRLHDHDRKNLAKAISGFGNSEGGVILWGIDCSKDRDGADVVTAKYPIKKIDRFVSLLQNSISVCTLPPHISVENHGIKIENSDEGFAVTFIPKSNHAPHQCVTDYKYYMRAGSTFSPVTHGILAGMFGRRPQPEIFAMFSIGPAKIGPAPNGEQKLICETGILFTNDGVGIAKDCFLNLEIISIPGNNCVAWFDFVDRTNWSGYSAFDYKIGVISKHDFRLPPHNYLQPLILNVGFSPPFDKAFNAELQCGCDGSPIYSQKFFVSALDVGKIYNEIIALSDLKNSQSLAGDILGLERQKIKK